MRMSNQEIDHIIDLVRTHMDFYRLAEMSKSDLKRLLSKETITDHLELFRVNCLSNRKSLETYSDYLKQLEEYKNQPAAPPLITGKDLIEMGYSPGPVFTEILGMIEDLQLEGLIRTRDEARHHIRLSFPRK